MYKTDYFLYNEKKREKERTNKRDQLERKKREDNQTNRCRNENIGKKIQLVYFV